MADTSFNYSTRNFRQNPALPGFWHYALRLSNDGNRYEIRLDKATLRLLTAT